MDGTLHVRAGRRLPFGDAVPRDDSASQHRHQPGRAETADQTVRATTPGVTRA